MDRETRRIKWLWEQVITRCYLPSNKAYKNYGARGITVSDEWRNSFSQFKSDMGDRPPGFTLERINNDLGYCKENCVWASRQQQALNRRLFKNNSTGIKCVEIRNNGSYRVRIRRFGKIVFDKTVGDFFSACCIKKSFELNY